LGNQCFELGEKCLEKDCEVSRICGDGGCGCSGRAAIAIAVPIVAVAITSACPCVPIPVAVSISIAVHGIVLDVDRDGRRICIA
jgi:hypothetical protein